MDRVVTLFGGGGFAGRYVAQALYKAGVRVRIAQRDPRQAFFLKPLGALGQTQFVRCDIRDEDQVAAALKGSWGAVNLVGILKGNFRQVHVEGARRIAEAAAAASVQSLAHISALGADTESPSAYGRSKGLGEEAVRAAFPHATIIRPSILFGREDAFINRFAGMARMLPILPVLRGQAKFQPLYAADFGRAVSAAVTDPEKCAGKTYELGGPQVMTMREIYEYVCDATRHERSIVDVPDTIGALAAKFTGWLPGAPITQDQWLMLQADNVTSANAPGLKDLGVTPTPLAAVSEGWLTRYRDHGRFAGKQAY
ncbi:MAG: complex I NDUFA9 subunit family protein [Sphingosinicella sp.]|nr:complex I NDUFA9 subunit family protein [Sphingosinicella sp.]